MWNLGSAPTRSCALAGSDLHGRTSARADISERLFNSIFNALPLVYAVDWVKMWPSLRQNGRSAMNIGFERFKHYCEAPARRTYRAWGGLSALLPPMATHPVSGCCCAFCFWGIHGCHFNRPAYKSAATKEILCLWGWLLIFLDLPGLLLVVMSLNTPTKII